MEFDDTRWDKHRRQGWKRRNNLATPLILVGLLLLLWLLWEMRAIVVAVLFSITLASAIAPVAEAMEKRKISRVATVVLVYILVGILYSVLFAALFPTLKEQALSLYDKLPNYASGLNDLYFRIREMLGESVGAIAVSPTDIRGFVAKLSGHALHFTSDLVTVIVTGILVLFLTGYFVIEANDLWSKLLDWVPQENRARAAGLIRPLEARLGGYIRGQLMVSLAVSVFLTIGLSLLRVEHAILLGSLSGLLNLVPFVGSMITAVLAVLVAFSQSPMLAGATVLLFVAEQWLESNIIVPNLLGKQVELHPLVVMFSILIGASIMGVPGALIAVPLATAGMFFAEEFYLRPLKQKESAEANNTTPAQAQSASGQHSIHHKQVGLDSGSSVGADDASSLTFKAPSAAIPSAEEAPTKPKPVSEQSPDKAAALKEERSPSGPTADHLPARPKEGAPQERTAKSSQPPDLDDTIPPESQP